MPGTKYSVEKRNVYVYASAQIKLQPCSSFRMMTLLHMCVAMLIITRSITVDTA